MDFKDHENDHPSVERLPLVHPKPIMPVKKNFKCSICSKKFKNETSLNYHSMFHTSEEKSHDSKVNVHHHLSKFNIHKLPKIAPEPQNDTVIEISESYIFKSRSILLCLFIS